jgi:hypothetical protein
MLQRLTRLEIWDRARLPRTSEAAAILAAVAGSDSGSADLRRLPIPRRSILPELTSFSQSCRTRSSSAALLSASAHDGTSFRAQ